MPSKKDKQTNPYAGWTDPALSDPGFERTLNRFIPPGCGKVDPAEQATSSIAASATEVTIKESLADLTPLATPLVTPLVTPPAIRTETSVATLDSTHTASEQKIYSVMYRLTISQGKRERHFTNKELLWMTGIRSPYTIRLAIDGLEAKRSIEIICKSNGNPIGDRYRIYTPREIFARRREIGIEIDPQSKKINSITKPFNTPLATPLATPPETRGVPLQKLEGSTAPSINININEEIDDDMRACARGVHDLLRSFFPETDPDRIKRACEEIDQLLVAELQERVKHAKTPPVSPQYFVECVQRLCSALQSIETPDSTPGKRSRNALKRKMEALAKSLREAHVGGGNYTLADLSEDLKRACARDGLPYDGALITEVIDNVIRRK